MYFELLHAEGCVSGDPEHMQRRLYQWKVLLLLTVILQAELQLNGA